MFAGAAGCASAGREIGAFADLVKDCGANFAACLTGAAGACGFETSGTGFAAGAVERGRGNGARAVGAAFATGAAGAAGGAAKTGGVTLGAAALAAACAIVSAVVALITALAAEAVDEGIDAGADTVGALNTGIERPGGSSGGA